MTDLPRVWRATSLMTIGTGASRLVGVLRISAMTYALGVTGTRLADTYNLANTTPNIIYELFLGGIFTAVFVPLLIEVRERRGRDVSPLLSISLIALAVVSTLALVGAPFIMRIYTFRIADPDVRAAQLELASFLLRWFAPQIFFYGVSAMAQGLLNTRGRFAPPAFAPVVNNLIVAAVFFTYARVIGTEGLDISTSGRILLGAGTTAGVMAQAFVLIPYLRGHGLRFRPDFRDPFVARAVRLASFVVLYVALNQIGLWVTLALANGTRGGVTAYGVAFTFFQLPHGLFAVSLHTALFPDLSRAASLGDWDAYRRWFSTGLRGVLYLLLPSAVGLGVLASPIARAFLVRGAADTKDAELVASVLGMFAIGLVFFSMFQLLIRSFMALPDTRTPAAIKAVAVAVNIGVNFPLFWSLGVRGLALGHAVSFAIGTSLLLTALHRRVPGGLHLGELASPLTRIAAAAAAMGICVWGITRPFPGGGIFFLGIAAGVGAILYLAFSQVAGLEERSILLDLVRQRRPKS